MSTSQVPAEPAARGAPDQPKVRSLLLRLIVPVPKGKGLRGKAFWIVRRCLLFYIVVIAMLAILQRYLIYQPARDTTINPELTGLRHERVQSVVANAADGLELHGWLVPRNPESTPIARENDFAVIYFPGNAGHRGYRGGELDLLSRLGANVYLFDYRGYGENSGSPTEEGLAADARTVWNEVVRREGNASRVVLLGESLGGGVSTRLAAEMSSEGTPPGGLILRSTFSTLPDIAAFHFPWLPVRLVLREHYRSTQRIQSVTCPILIVHGDADTIVPLQFGKRLFEAAPEKSSQGVAKTFAELRGAGHNDILYIARQPYATAISNFFTRCRTSR